MINNRDKLKEYIDKYPDQVYVSQNNLFNDFNYNTQELGYAGLKIIIDNMPDPKGQYNQHERYIIDYIKLQYNYMDSSEIDPSDEVYELAEEVYEIAIENYDIFTVYSVFAGFIEDIEFENKLLDKIGDNLNDKDLFEYIHNDDTQIVGGRIVPDY